MIVHELHPRHRVPRSLVVHDDQACPDTDIPAIVIDVAGTETLIVWRGIITPGVGLAVLMHTRLVVCGPHRLDDPTALPRERLSVIVAKLEPFL